MPHMPLFVIYYFITLVQIHGSIQHLVQYVIWQWHQWVSCAIYCLIWCLLRLIETQWWRSIVVRPPFLPACFPYPALDWQLAV